MEIASIPICCVHPSPSPGSLVHYLILSLMLALCDSLWELKESEHSSTLTSMRRTASRMFHRRALKESPQGSDV